MQPVSARERALAAQVSGNWVRPNCLWRTGHDPISWKWRMGLDGRARAHFLAAGAESLLRFLFLPPLSPVRDGATVRERGGGKSFWLCVSHARCLLSPARCVYDVSPSDLPAVVDGRTPQTHSVWEKKMWAASFRVGRRAQSAGGGIARQHLACGVEMLIHTAK